MFVTFEYYHLLILCVPPCEDVSREEEEHSSLEAATRQRDCGHWYVCNSDH
jgi:hypothetical protein